MTADRQRAKDRFGDGWCRCAHVEGVHRGPLAGAFLACGIEHDVDEGLAGNGVGLLEDVSGDLDQEGVQLALVPLGKNVTHFGGAEAEHVLHQIVGLADHLHVAVLDAVVHHFHVVTGTVGTDIGGAAEAAFDRFAGRSAFSSGLPVSGSTLAAMASQMGLSSSQAAGSPPRA